MPNRQRVKVISPAEANASGEAGGFPFDQFGLHLLAQGDSWFSIGAVPPWQTTRVLDELEMVPSTVIVNCAQPGGKLARMVDTTASRLFTRELKGRLARAYHAILFSGGGNDLIEAAGSPADASPDKRLLRTPAERGAGATAAQHVSEPGWRTFDAHIGAVFHRLIDARDSGINRGKPLLLHNYAKVVPRPAGAGFGAGPWLLPPLQRYAVAADMLVPVSDELIARLSRLLARLVSERPNVHLVDTLTLAGVVPAQPGSGGSSGDWINEIHLTDGGYRKCARVWEPRLDAVIG
jgi:hypothetical protein